MKTSYSQFLSKIAYLTILIVASCYALATFVRPMEDVHAGINSYHRSKFLDMVHGTAYKPFVYRTLLPTTVRLVSLATPKQYHQAFTDTVGEKHQFLFKALGWETSAAYEYSIALILMLGSFMGFAHYLAKLVMLTCNLGEARNTRLLLAASALLGLPPLFVFVSYPYDPPQLLLFTMALYFLATSRLRAFIFTFVLCCINKETAVLLIPLCALTVGKKCSSPRRYWGLLLGLLFGYLGIKSLITFAFRSSPGSFVECHLWHNVGVFTRGWTFIDVTTLLILVLLLFYRWNEKPAFLKVSFLCVLPPMIALALFLGYIDEWRGYYEAYPIVFGLIVDSLLRLRRVLNRDIETMQPRGPSGNQQCEHAQR